MQGASIVCQRPLSPEERFLLTITTPSGPMQVIAQVVWADGDPQEGEEIPFAMGVRFVWSSL